MHKHEKQMHKYAQFLFNKTYFAHKKTSPTFASVVFQTEHLLEDLESA